jgi:hypothetical protein
MVRSIAVLMCWCFLAIGSWAQTTQGNSPQAQTPGAIGSPSDQEAVTKQSASSPPAALPTEDHSDPDPFHQFKEFSAIMKGDVLPREEREGYIYRSGDLLRMEGLERRGFYITDLETLDTHAISKLGCAYMKQAYVRSFPFMLHRQGYTVTRVKVGKETVDGHACDVEEVTYSSKNLPSSWHLKVWEAEDLQGFPIKVDAEPSTGPSHSIILFKNVRLGPQDPTLFIYPKDCTELAKPSEQKPSSPKPKKPAAAPSGDTQKP